MVIQRTPQLRSGSVVKEGVGEGFTKVLDIRVPTTTPNYSADKVDQVLKLVQPGDIVLETNNAYPNWQRMEHLVARSSFTHAFMIEGDGKLLEATTGPGVTRTDLQEYLKGPVQLAIMRPEWKSPDDVNKALDYCRSQLGKPYDSDFRLDDDGKKQYCAELVYRALEATGNHYEVPTVKVMGREGVAPDAFLKMSDARLIYTDGSNFWKNLSSHWPVAAGATALGAAGYALGGGIAGAAVGFLTGLPLSICVGNEIQTGHFNLAGEAHK